MKNKIVLRVLCHSNVAIDHFLVETIAAQLQALQDKASRIEIGQKLRKLFGFVAIAQNTEIPGNT